jgi:tetratricopeptide (TPR) repeat protein/tRNA A-37 threonylcarbamoyl transferase component Bud32
MRAPITPENWQRVKQIAADALELQPEARAVFVQRSCGAESELLGEVESLLAMGDPDTFLEPERPPERVGVYRIMREIGRGGMGAVYQGDRDDGLFEQRVAIKVVHRGMDTSAVLRRFALERQILARLEHPNIARLLDGGETADGRPYFVMEYLEAEPLLAYCRRRQLSVDRRLELFITVCEAVEHAHRHLVLHRDIKPGNIVVNSDGTPKLLDFGIAKVLENDGTALATEAGLRALTPQYSSPEQMRGEPLTTTSDVYALGLLLYELLAECPPYEVPGGAPAAQMQIVCEWRPPRPSDVAPASVARRIRGDLDNVVFKALEKEPSRRYSRAADLAEDLRRYRDSLPVLARPAGLLYRTGKFASRNWRALTIAAVVLIVLTGAIAQALIQGRRAARRFQDVRQLANSFLFEFHDAIAKLPGSTPARELVVKRALQYLDSLSREAAGDLDLKKELAESYLRVANVQGDANYTTNLGKTTEAITSLNKAIALFTEVYHARPSDPGARTDLARAKLALSAELQRSDPARAVALQKGAIALSQGTRASAPGLLDRAKYAEALAYFAVAEADGLAGRIPQSLEARARCINLLDEVATSKPEYDDAQRLLGMAYKRRAATYIKPLNDLDKARYDLDKGLAIDDQRIAHDPTNAVARLDQALGQSYLSVLLRRKGDFRESEKMIDRALATRIELLAADPGNVRNRTWLMGDYAKLAALRRAENRLPESMEAIQEGLDVAEQAGADTKKNDQWLAFSGVLHLEAAQTRAEQGACQEASDHLVLARKLDTEPSPESFRKAEASVAGCSSRSR